MGESTSASRSVFDLPMTTLFYAPPDHVRGGELTLPDGEAHHATSVLRHTVGDEIEAVDGCGNWYRVRLDHVNRTSVAGRIVEHRRDVGEPPYELTMAVAALKNPGRYEVFVEKAVELGVAAIVPVITARTERFRLKVDRFRRLSVAAMKQCGRSRLIRIDEAAMWQEVVQSREEQIRLVCHEEGGGRRSIVEAVKRDVAAHTILIAVGPEGGFTHDEVQEAITSGFSLVSLGPRRLRTETAAITAAASVMLASAHAGGRW